MPTSRAQQRLIVAIDGPAGTGKSSVARQAARRLGLTFLDTGAMYRAATALALEESIPLRDGPAIARRADEARMRFDWATDPPALLAFGEDISARLRADDVEANVSAVSSLPEVREVMVALQRRIGKERPMLLTEGRDQGSVVFPDADVKIYLDATLEARAARRAAQMKQERPERDVDVAAVRQAIAERDHRDKSRRVGRLVRPHDAALLDTSGLTFEESVDAVVMLVESAAARRGSHEDRGALAGEVVD